MHHDDLSGGGSVAAAIGRRPGANHIEGVVAFSRTEVLIQMHDVRGVQPAIALICSSDFVAAARGDGVGEVTFEGLAVGDAVECGWHVVDHCDGLSDASGVTTLVRSGPRATEEVVGWTRPIGSLLRARRLQKNT